MLNRVKGRSLSIKVGLGFLSALLLILAIGLSTNPIGSQDPVADGYDEQKPAKHWDTPRDRFSVMPSALGEWQKRIRTPDDLEEPSYSENYLIEAYRNSKQSISNLRTQELVFVERGPGNISGRTRALLILATDESKNTWLAGAASGGIWKTTDGGLSWSEKSLDLPNLAISSLAYSPLSPDTIYAGTGEPFCGFPSVDGNGVLKSVDAGETWAQVLDPVTFPALKNISRVIVDPNNPNIVLVSGENSFYSTGLNSVIYKTTDGGQSWVPKFQSTNHRIQQIVFDPSNFSIQYAALNGFGVIKSTDAGETWVEATNGLDIGGRIEIGVSPVRTSRLWASVEGNLSGTGSDLYVSDDSGQNWRLVVSSGSEDNIDFLEGQGCYDNTVLAHPFDDNIVYVGGVDLYKFTLTGDEGPQVQLVDMEENGTGVFMDFVNFGATYNDGKLDAGNADSLINVEIRFGQGTQKAHRFTVNQRGSGVPDNEYLYLDYVDVPFQVWNTETNTQLMASFRDQAEDGSWNLTAQNTDGDPSTHSREYVYVHLQQYADSANASIAVAGGQEFQQLYTIWPVLIGDSFNPTELPESSIRVLVSTITTSTRNNFQISDSRNITSESINANTQEPERVDDGIHPDHHLLVALLDSGESEFRILSTNDGGVYLSKKSSEPGTMDEAFEYRSFGYNTTQFYAADKAPGSHRYVGGMQDNGSQISPASESANDSSRYLFANSGDGFEVIWNKREPNWIITSAQNNGFKRSLDGGNTWISAEFSDEGPFYSKISNSTSKPDKVYSIANRGVWISTDFASNWEVTEIENPLWNLDNFSPYVEVSPVNDEIVWAGSGLSEGNRLFVSNDAGQTFNPVETYVGETLGSISGLTLDPIDENTAYAIFSFAGRPKILKTTDLGQTWEDISGFEGNEVSDRGFPDVAVFSLLVFNYDPNIMWAGTEIGLFESLDGGQSWAFLQSNLPSVAIFDFKIVDDQVVLATFGRGIWSVTIPEVEQEIVFSPFLGRVTIDPFGKTSYEMEFSSIFDSTTIEVNEEMVLSFQGNELGTVIKESENLGFNETAQIQINSYLNGQPYKSDILDRILFEPEDFAIGYKTNFREGSSDDFASIGFDVLIADGFESPALQTEHEYPQSTELFSILKTPITISGNNPTLFYRDIALVETGEDGSRFGETDFFDYVVVEGSTDGRNWIPLADGYDASFNSDWLQTYNSGGIGNPELFVEHSIDLSETFDPGETILIRFRLFSDPFEVGWGWLIDDIYIQEEILSLTEEIVDALAIYPNPVAGNSVINYTLSDAGVLSILGIDGRRVWTREISESGQIQFPVDQLRPGVYAIQLRTPQTSIVQKIIVQ